MSLRDDMDDKLKDVNSLFVGVYNAYKAHRDEHLKISEELVSVKHDIILLRELLDRYEDNVDYYKNEIAGSWHEISNGYKSFKGDK